MVKEDTVTTASQGAEFREGDEVTVQTGEAAGRTGKVTKVLPSQETVRGTGSYFAFKTDISSEYYRAQDLKRGR